jgi:23S rRNA pseudouridine955/2504/2580 synthase
VKTAQLLTSLFRLRKVHKTYLAICHGEIDKDKGEWNNDLIRYDNEKKIIENAKTIYTVLDKKFKLFSSRNETYYRKKAPIKKTII